MTSNSIIYDLQNVNQDISISVGPIYGDLLPLLKPKLLVPVYLDALVVDDKFANNRADIYYQKPDPFHPDFKGKCPYIDQSGTHCEANPEQTVSCRGQLQECEVRMDVLRRSPFKAPRNPKVDSKKPIISRDHPDSGQGYNPPELFTGSSLPLREGVHLHWAMPDAMTHGTPDGEDGDMTFPQLPNRWLVVRTTPNDCLKEKVNTSSESDKKLMGKAWVVISDGGQEGTRNKRTGKMEYRRVVDLSKSSFDETKCQKLPFEELTALSGGEPTDLALYDNCYDRFGFHDSLTDVDHGPVSYHVFGWYGGESVSLLSKIKSEADFKQTLADFNWGLESDAENGQEESFGGWTWAAGCDLLCHGSVYDVKWKMPSTLDRKPPVQDLFFGIGCSQEGALGALLTHDSDHAPSYGRLLAGFMEGQLSEVTSSNQLSRFAYLAHQRGFSSMSGGYYEVNYPHSVIEPVSRQRSSFERGYLDSLRSAKKEKAGGAKKGKRPEPSMGMMKKGMAKPTGKRSLTPPLVSGVAVSKEDPFATAQRIESMGDFIGGKRPPHFPRRKKMLRAKPRYYRPKDPVLLISGANRGVKHGEDGRFDDQGRLICRLGTEAITTVEVEYSTESDRYVEVIHNRGSYPVYIGSNDPSSLEVKGSDLIDLSFLKGVFLDEIGAILSENIIFDSASSARFVELVVQHEAEVNNNVMGTTAWAASLAMAYTQQITEKPLYAMSSSFRNMVDLRDETIRTSLKEDSDGPDVIPPTGNIIIGNGHLPSVHGMRKWEQPWTPVHLEWQVELQPSKEGISSWELDGVGYSLPDAFTEAEQLIKLQGRSILTPGAVSTMYEALKRSLLDEKTNDIIGADTEKSLAEVVELMGKANVIGTSFGGFHDQLLGKMEEYLVSQDVSDSSSKAVAWLREGRLYIKRLRIVDSFGRYLDTTDPKAPKMEDIIGSDEIMQEVMVEDTENVKATRAMLLLPPRISSPARLTFRFLNAESSGVTQADEAGESVSNSGICGWCMPDHLDGALEFFDAGGQNLGQLRVASSMDRDDAKGAGFGVTWEGAPGEDGSYGGTLETSGMNRHMRNMVAGIRSFEAEDKDPEIPETSLSALLRTIDTTGWAVDVLGRTGTEHMSVLLGKPLAVVRAKITFEVKHTGEDSGYEELCRVPFPVLIGNVREQTDGVMGFYINDDYKQFHAIDPGILDAGLAPAAHVGFMYYNSPWGKSQPMESQPIEHPFINGEPCLYVRPGQTVVLTILVDPRGGIHATSGILPQKRLDLIQEQIKPALDAMAVTFMVGPVLVDPVDVRMPHPHEIKGNWQWLHRKSPVLWQEESITPSDDRARFSASGVEAHDGWLKFSGGVGKNN